MPTRRLRTSRKAITLDPKSALPYAGLADAQVKKFDNREGPKWLELAAANVAEAETINVDSAPVLLVSGAVLERQGSYESALHAFTRAAELAPTNPEGWKAWARLMTRPTVATMPSPPTAAPWRRSRITTETISASATFYWYRSEFKQAGRTCTAGLLTIWFRTCRRATWI